MITPSTRERIIKRARQRGTRIGLLPAQSETRDELRVDVLRYAALRAGLGQYTDTFTVELRDGTPAVALIRIDLIPDASVDPSAYEA